MKKIVIDTGMVPVWSNKVKFTDGTNFIPATEPISTALVKTAKFSQYLESTSVSDIKCRYGYQMSDDGINWTLTPQGLGQFVANPPAWKYLDVDALSIASNLRLFVRFGFVCGNAIGGGGGKIHKGASRLIIEIAPTNGQTFAAERVPVSSDKTTTSGVFYPTSEPIPIESVGEIRSTLRLEASTDDVKVQAAYQVSDDGVTWDSGATSAPVDSFTAFGSSRTTDGVTYGTTFDTFSPTKKRQWVRFGVMCQNETGDVHAESSLASLRVDTRL